MSLDEIVEGTAWSTVASLPVVNVSWAAPSFIGNFPEIERCFVLEDDNSDYCRLVNLLYVLIKFKNRKKVESCKLGPVFQDSLYQLSGAASESGS